ncbi:MAG: M12 family metallo-peptidase [Acidobacteria bacterium]|nr:M12 family metallo-peptidase [Acidobacteriota bacterium]
MGDEIDVAVVYTPAARDAAGGTAAIGAVIDLMVAETNEALAAGDVQHRVVLVERSEVAYRETGDTSDDLYRLWDGSDGQMDEVHALREGAGADLVHLIVGDYDFCGTAYIGAAFGLTGLRCGGGTFAHELGHNMGLQHDRYQVDGGRSAHPAYGYVNQRAFDPSAAPSRRWRTVMAYPDQCDDAGFRCTRLLRFSNPRQLYGGDPIGVRHAAAGKTGVTGSADAAAVLEATGAAVALWRDPPSGRTNRPPASVGALPDRTLTLDSMLEVDVSQVFVDPDGDMLTYGASSSVPSVASVSVSGSAVTVVPVAPGAATITVTATDTNGSNRTATQLFTVTVVRPFTDHPIVPGVTPVRAIHFTELRTRIDALRSMGGLARFTWTDPVLRAGVTRVRLVHLTELRSALAAAYSAAGRSVPRWTDATLVGGTTPIRAAHLMELRAAVLALE